MKIAMYGGSFDPVHNAHINLCKTMIADFDLDKVIVFPAATSPFKSASATDASHRLQMCRLAFEDTDRVEVSDSEIKRGGKSYTADTLKELKALYPEAELYLITGADAFLTLSAWYNSSLIFSLAHILTVVRDNDDIRVLSAKAEEYKANGASCTLVNKSMGNISSTVVRKLITDDKDVSAYLPKKVIRYIKDNKLYNYGNQ